MSKLRVGIVGTGSISNEHINAYLHHPDVELCAFCDIDEIQLNEMGDRYGINSRYTDLDQMLHQQALDAVSICTWNSTHAPCAIKALNAGVNVLCEKPMSISAGDAQAMNMAAKQNNKLLMIGFVRRFGNDCGILQDLINQSFFGDLYYAKATYLRRNGSPGGWFGDKSRSGGGPLIDLGVHVIDLIRYLMGNPKPVSVYGLTFHQLGDRKGVKSATGYQSAGAKETDIFDVEDLASALIRFDNGSALSVEASFSLNLKEDKGTIELFGTKGGAKLDPELELYSDTGGYLSNTTLNIPTALSFSGLFQNEINHFVSCIKHHTPCLAPAQDGVEMMQILDAIYKSASTEHEVIL